MLSVRETCFLFPPGPGVDWRREAFYGLVVIVDKLSIFCFLLDLGSSGEEKLSIFCSLLDLGSAGEELSTDLLYSL